MSAPASAPASDLLSLVALDRLTDSHSAALDLLASSPPLTREREWELAARIQDAQVSPARRRAAREELWRANLRLCWRVVTRVARARGAGRSGAVTDTRLDLFQSVALTLWQKTAGYSPDTRTGQGGQRARFGTWVMPTLRSAATRAVIADEPIRRPVWVVARERQAARRVVADLVTSGLTWDDLSAADAETRMLAALDDIALSMRANLREHLRLFRPETVLMGRAAQAEPRYGRYGRPDHLTPRERGGVVTMPRDDRDRRDDRDGESEQSEQEALEHAYARSVAQGYARDPYTAEAPTLERLADAGPLFSALSPELAPLIAALDPRRREALRLRFEQGLPLRRIGELLDPPASHTRVGQLIEEALAQIRANDRAQGGALRALAAPRQPTHE